MFLTLFNTLLYERVEKRILVNNGRSNSILTGTQQPFTVGRTRILYLGKVCPHPLKLSGENVLIVKQALNLLTISALVRRNRSLSNMAGFFYW